MISLSVTFAKASIDIIFIRASHVTGTCTVPKVLSNWNP